MKLGSANIVGGIWWFVPWWISWVDIVKHFRLSCGSCVRRRLRIMDCSKKYPAMTCY